MTTATTLLGASVLALSAGAASAQDRDLLVFDYAGFENPVPLEVHRAHGP
jgi:hypothetical protein